MAIQDDNTLVTKGDLKALYGDKIAPYLGANLAISTNNSEYFSTNEKVVGVWIDGRPIYQKTLTCNLGNATTVNNPHNISNLDFVIDMFGYGKDSSGNSFPVPYAPVGNISWGVQIYVSATNITCATAQNWSGSTVKVTLRYVKTTDTASSALSAGAYDINFPNTWPENTEIYFGNGLYGYHFTSTKTITSYGVNEAFELPLNYKEIIKGFGSVTWSNGYSFNLTNGGKPNASDFQYAGLVYYTNVIYITTYGPAGSTKCSAYLIYTK